MRHVSSEIELTNISSNTCAVNISDIDAKMMKLEIQMREEFVRLVSALEELGLLTYANMKHVIKKNE